MSAFTVTIENNSYVVKFPYDPGAVAALKASIPSTGRSWSNDRKAWIIAADQRRNAENALGMTFPEIVASKPVTETRLLEIHYIGQCKERAPGDISAMGLLSTGSWGVILPEATLRSWFEDDFQRASSTVTLYAILGAKQGDDEQALKSAYRRMVKQTHPDVCREPDAHVRFLRLQEAWAVLGDQRKKSRYDAGLALEASINANFAKGSSFRQDFHVVNDLYRAPLRTGYILAEGTESLGRFVVSKILAWDDVMNERGQTLVVSWPMGAKEPVKVWA